MSGDEHEQQRGYHAWCPTTCSTQLVQKLVKAVMTKKQRLPTPITNYTPIIFHLLVCNFYLLEFNKAYKV